MLRWMIFHLFVFLYFSVLLVANAHAYELDSGSCRLDKISQTEWQISSPNDGSRTTLDSKRFEAEFGRKLAGRLGSEAATELMRSHANYDAFVSCSSAGHDIVVNLAATSTTPALCVRTDEKLSKLDIFSNNEPQSGVACSGQAPERLLASAVSPDTTAQIVARLSDPALSSVVHEASVDGSVVKIMLKPSLRYSEAKALQALTGDSELVKAGAIVDYDRMNFIVGESAELFHANL